MKDCGSCALCCKLPELPGFKPPGVWCPNIDLKKHKERCKAYEERPKGCREFECMWRLYDSAPEDMRPDRCGVLFEVLEEEKVVALLVDYKKVKNLNWTKGKSGAVIIEMRNRGYVVGARVNGSRHLFLPKGVAKEEAMNRIISAWERKNDRTKLHRGPDRLDFSGRVDGLE